jgi:hypothetical protein
MIAHLPFRFGRTSIPSVCASAKISCNAAQTRRLLILPAI